MEKQREIGVNKNKVTMPERTCLQMRCVCGGGGGGGGQCKVGPQSSRQYDTDFKVALNVIVVRLFNC